MSVYCICLLLENTSFLSVRCFFKIGNWLCWLCLEELLITKLSFRCARATKITSFMANHLCYEYEGDSGRVEYALHNIGSVERVSELRCDFVRRSHCKILTTIWWLCECLGREFWPGGGNQLCGNERKNPKSFVRCARNERHWTGMMECALQVGFISQSHTS